MMSGFARMFTNGAGRVVAVAVVLAVLVLSFGVSCAASFLSAGSAPKVSAAPDASSGSGPAALPAEPSPADSPDPLGGMDDGVGDASPLPAGDQADYAACGAAAAKFGVAYSTGASGDTRDRWLSRVLPFLDHGAASEATRSAAFQRGRLPAGKVTDVAVDVKGDSCTGVIRYSDGSTVGPALVRSGQGWIVTGLESWEVEGGQEPSITAPGPNEFASPTPTVGDGA